MKLTKFGKKMTSKAGILSLMDDLGQAKMEGGEHMVMMGGGNPAQIPEFQEIMRQELLNLCSDPEEFRRLVGSYGSPQGESSFIEGLANLLRQELGWNITSENICLTNGSQTAFFMLFNLFGGEMEDGTKKKICLPMAPEYIGYADLGLDDGLFVSTRPKIETLDETFFKYHIDFEKLQVDSSIGAICISRPTNPTGNVISDEELLKLMELARRQNIPLVVDCAYGLPFPGMIYTKATPIWNENLIVSLSLSKLGLPAVRTGIIVASKEIVRALTCMNAIMSLSPNSFGALLAEKLVTSSRITALSKTLMQPYYSRKKQLAVAAVQEFFTDTPCRIHVPEGAMFLWLWFKDLPITSLELYERLKKAGALVVSGHYFFPGLQENWKHKDECLRVTYSQDDAEVRKGLKIISEVVRAAYNRELCSSNT
ncbi:valine--pyruvate transaminase [Desulforhopalus sp. IMCC35007]|uniref:valine--pyruvate transaminase n=1 Tax=Desulforhopalus sp. IMCC35007 TaxID=2569543 RepID=UPI0010AEABD6|nr:valine--pyruvate transaminase [Desulforhopalus sp. IMCC35007]TKB09038.1 valine--pyruvate transaminase [Desulforhopalus sp. IMCC35007]